MHKDIYNDIIIDNYTYHSIYEQLKNKYNINAISKTGCTALMFACEKDLTVDVIKLLIEHGADLNIQDHVGDTALIVAARNNVEYVKILIENGANLDLENNIGHAFIKYIDDNDLSKIKYWIGERYSLLNQCIKYVKKTVIH